MLGDNTVLECGRGRLAAQMLASMTVNIPSVHKLISYFSLQASIHPSDHLMSANPLQLNLARL